MVEAANKQGDTVEHVGGDNMGGANGTAGGERRSRSGQILQGRATENHWEPGDVHVDG